MQQLLYKYLILNNRLNIPSLGSFSVSYQPARLNSSTGSLDPKQPVLHFKDGPPATPDTGLIPFLASEMKISPASAANELLNFSLQVMSELVEHQRARLKGLGTLTKDGGGLLHFEQENSPIAVQSSVVAREPSTAPVTVATAPSIPTPATHVAPQPVAAAPMPSIPSRTETPVRTSAPASITSENSKLPPGQLDPSLDYASIKSYQESPELSQVRQQLAQRREQVNSVFGDLREARERMNRVPLPGKEGESFPPSAQPPSSFTSNPTRPSSIPTPPPSAPRMPRSTTGTGRRPNPLLSPDPMPARQPQWQPSDTSSRNTDSNTFTGMPNEFPARSPFGKPDESAAFKKDSDALSGLPIDVPCRTPRSNNPPPIPPITSRRNTEPPVFPESNEPAPAWTPTPRPSMPPANRSWNVPNDDTPPAVPFSRSVPPAADGGAVRDMKRSPLRRQPIPSPIPTPVPETKTGRWAPQENDTAARQAFTLPNRFVQQEEVEEEEEVRPGFFARMKAGISGLFQRNRVEEEVTTIEEQIPEEETAGGIGGIFSKASAKFEEIKSNELDASAEEKKDYWWIYSIFLGSVATLALIFRLF